MVFAWLLMTTALSQGGVDVRVLHPDGSPAAGAAVEVRKDLRPETAATDADGVATFPTAPRGTAWRTRVVSADGALGAAYEMRPPKGGLTLEPVAAKPVRVVDGGGRPVAGALVGYKGPPPPGEAYGDWADLQTTDEEGRATLLLSAATLALEEPGQYSFYAMKPGAGFDYFLEIGRAHV